MKVYVHYEEGLDTDLHVTLKLTLPKKWEAKNPFMVLELFVESYNKRKPDNQLVAADLHLKASGKVLTHNDIIGDVMKHQGDVHVLHGPMEERKPQQAPKAEKGKEEPRAGSLRCRNFGCNQHYDEETNSDSACRHHTAPPIFHDTRKGWGCCEKRVYDWDEFERLEGCTVSRHDATDPKDKLPPKPPSEEQVAEKEKVEAPVLKSIANFNKENVGAATAAGSASKAILRRGKKSTRRADGTASCLNKGCQKDFNVSENGPASCRYHIMNPIFHDGGKHWACCPGKVKYSFEDFVAVEGCRVGYHDDGTGDFINSDGCSVAAEEEAG